MVGFVTWATQPPHAEHAVHWCTQCMREAQESVLACSMTVGCEPLFRHAAFIDTCGSSEPACDERIREARQGKPAHIREHCKHIVEGLGIKHGAVGRGAIGHKPLAVEHPIVGDHLYHIVHT